MGFIDWLKKISSPETKLKRLERKVERDELKASYAKAELPLLIRKDQAETIINKRDLVRRGLLNKKLKKINQKLNKPSSVFNNNLKLKTPEDRIFKK